jgi:hypothetical protein
MFRKGGRVGAKTTGSSGFNRAMAHMHRAALGAVQV